MIKRIPTSIEGFDDLIEGGLPCAKTVLLSGPAGTGKTIFCIQYLWNGITKYEENGVFVTLGERKKHIIEYMKGFGWDLTKVMKENKLRMIDLTPIPKGPVKSVKYMMAEKPDEEFTMDGVADILRQAIQDVGAKRVVVDSLKALLLLPQEGFVQRHELLALTNMLEDMKCTSIITTEVPVGERLSPLGFEEFIAHGVVKLDYSLKKNEYQRSLVVWKMRGTNQKRGVYSFQINSNGITVRKIAEWD